MGVRGAVLLAALFAARAGPACTKAKPDFGECGPSCTLDTLRVFGHSVFPRQYFAKESTSCPRLFSRAFMPTPKLKKRILKLEELPEDVQKSFLLPNTTTLRPFIGIDEGTSNITRWNIQGCKSIGGSGYGPAADALVKQALQALPWKSIERVAVLGSRFPWLECFVRGFGAPSVTTIEHGIVECPDCEAHGMRVFTPKQFYERMLECKEEKFDVVVSFSSIEHSGLGRYWDPINPFGDVEEVARIHCMLKPDGLLVIGVPTNNFGSELHFNAHRVYGPDRYVLLTSNFKAEAMFGKAAYLKGVYNAQPVLIFRRLGFTSNFTEVPAERMALVPPTPFYGHYGLLALAIIAAVALVIYWPRRMVKALHSIVPVPNP